MKWLKLFLVITGFVAVCYVRANNDDVNRKAIQEYNTLFLEAFNQGYNYKAREYAGKSLIVAIKAGFRRDVALANSNLAIINTRMGDYEKANENNFTALRIFKEMNDTLHIARCNLSIGTVYIRLKEYTKALNYIKEAMDSFYQLKNMLGYSICLSNTGSIYMELKDYRKALPIFFEAVDIDERNNDMSGTSSNFADIGIIYLKLGNYKAASEYLYKALALDKVMGDISGMANVELNLSKLMMEKGKMDSALYHAENSQRYYRESGQLSGMADVYSHFADLYERKSDYKRAYKFYTQATALNDSLMNVEKAARIAMLEEKYINEKLSTEILSLQFRNNLQEAKLKNQRILGITWLTGLILSAIAIVIIMIQLRNKNIAYKYIVSKNIDLMRKEKELYDMNARLNLLMNQTESQPEVVHEEKHRVNLSDDEKTRLLAKLKEALQRDRVYTRSDLNIDKLARKLSTNRTYLSQLINDEFQRTYSDLINEYRIKAAMEQLSDPVLSNKYSIDAIAKESGFNNISTFNALFRKYVGLTPSVFRKNAQQQAIEPHHKSYELTKS